MECLKLTLAQATQANCFELTLRLQNKNLVDFFIIIIVLVPRVRRK